MQSYPLRVRGLKLRFQLFNSVVDLVVSFTGT